MAFQPFVARAHQAHTRIETDFSGYFAYRAGGGAGFPLGIAIVEGDMIITDNASGVDAIKPGDRISAIADVSVAELLPRLNEILMRVVDLGTVERRNHLAALHTLARSGHVQPFDSSADPCSDRSKASFVIVDATEQPPLNLS